MKQSTKAQRKEEKLLALQDKHPVLIQKHQSKEESLSVKIADRLTTFVGSMKFVYIHAILFGTWCATGLFGLDKYPFNFLTMTVSLEAIFLSTFVMIAQNRQAEFAEAKADHEYQVEHAELVKNTALSENIYALTIEVHKLATEISVMQDELTEHITTTVKQPKIKSKKIANPE